MSPNRLLSNTSFAIKMHIGLGGKTHDPVGIKLLEKFADVAARIPQIQQILETYSADKDTIMFVFENAVLPLDSQPCVKTPVEALVAGLIFQEPDIFRNILHSASTQVKQLAGPDPHKQVWYSELAKRSGEIAKELRDAHEKEYGKASFVIGHGRGLHAPVVTTGCLKSSTVLIGLGILTGLVICKIAPVIALSRDGLTRWIF